MATAAAAAPEAKLGCSVLLIDNFDSFTYNLAQLIGELCGRQPLVVTNAVCWEEVQRLISAHSVDAIVISPGPGNPADNPADFGVCAAVLQRCAHIPTLAVCLGHQGLAHLHGGRVMRAPQPMHGRLSEITVLDDESVEDERLFHGIPSGCKVVRYHSLVVERSTLPTSLRPLAETEDGLLMAFRVVSRPQWGVQYHPESVCTEHGKLLLRNFLGIACRIGHACQTKDCVEPSRSPPLTPPEADDSSRASKRLKASHEPHLQLLVDSMPFPDDDSSPGDFPAAVYTALFSQPPSHQLATFWLDSATASSSGVATGDRRARFTFMGGSDGPLAHTVEYSEASRTLTVVSPGSSGRTTAKLGGGVDEGSCLFDWLQRKVAEMREPTIERVGSNRQEAGSGLPFEFCGGYVGYLSYELRHECGHAAEEKSRQAAQSREDEIHAPPTAALLFADRFLAFDMERRDVYVLSLAQQPNRSEAMAWITQTKASILAIASAEDAGCIPVAEQDDRDVGHSGGSQHYVGGSWLNAKLARGKAQYLADIQSSLDSIAAGETYEVCLTTGVAVDEKPPVLPLYSELRRSNPAPYGALLRFGCEPGEGKGGFAVLSSSPERFLKIGENGTIESKPIKGTARRGTTVDEDRALCHGLRTCEKERAENLMIVDLTRHDLGQVCEVGSVHVPEGKLFDVESYATVHQLVSTVRGQLPITPEGLASQSVRAVAACFPPGSMTGAPKHRTMQIIDQLEQRAPRGVYSGSLGFFSLSGAVDLSVVIRTLVVSDGGVRIGGGGAITYQSTPAEEFAEVILKLSAPLLAVARVLGKAGVDFGAECDGERLRLPVVSAGRPPETAAFTTVPWDYARGKDDGYSIWLWQMDMYLQRLTENCERLQIVAPEQGFRAELERAVRGWTPPAVPIQPDQQGQGLFRVEWSSSGVMSLAGRILPVVSQAKRAALAAVSLPAPWWKRRGATGTKHADWSPYHDAMHRAWAQGGYCALLVDPDGTVIDGDRVTPILAETSDGTSSTSGKIVLRYPLKRAGAVESITIRALRQELDRLEGDGQEGPRMVLRESSFSLRDVQAATTLALLVVGSGVGVGNIGQLNGSPIGRAKRAGDAFDAHKIYTAVANCLSKAREAGWEMLASRDL